MEFVLIVYLMKTVNYVGGPTSATITESFYRESHCKRALTKIETEIKNTNGTKIVFGFCTRK